MSREPVLKVAINAPLSRLFDYLPPASPERAVEPGCRLRVPFGRRTQTGMLLEVGSQSELPLAKLKRAHEVLDEAPLLRAPDVRLIRFTSDYYHHPVGEVVAAALPALLRQGKPLHPAERYLVLSDEGRSADITATGKKAPRQAELLELLQRAGGMSFDELDRTMPGWNRVRKALLERRLVEIVERRSEDLGNTAVGAAEAGPVLNPDQSAAVREIGRLEDFSVSLLDGVTGSGKTEVYLRLIQDVLGRGQQALVLVPEIGLTPQFVARLEKRLGLSPVILHSSLSDHVRLEAWRAVRSGEAQLVVGTRSAVFVPLKNPGLIVVDEEHDSSFKQQEGLRYSARDLAVARAKELDIPVILGSATPSLETLQRCVAGMYRRLVLPVRAGSAAPPLLRLVDLNRHPPAEGLSLPVVDAMRRHLDEDGQVLVFLNRRGFAPTLICQSCGGIAECNRCDARMTVHSRSNRLMCHHCGATRPLDATCRACGNPVRPLGHGTERLEDALQLHFPAEQVMRVDSDSTRQKGSLDRALEMAASGDTGILVGTQILSKGHHFPKLTLVVVIDADQGLFSTDFRGTERLAQSLMQVAGRAGREQRQGEVMIQTAFASHPFWQELLQGGYARVAAAALAEREKAAWPPFSHLALLRAAANRRQDTYDFLEAARRTAEAINIRGVRVLGPVAAPMERRAGRYRAQLLLQSRNRGPLHRLLQALREDLETSSAGRRVRWSIDVDPIELF
jgi:primosomal protein N' (replication factor Y) (superfamily II helicase)